MSLSMVTNIFLSPNQHNMHEISFKNISAIKPSGLDASHTKPNKKTADATKPAKPKVPFYPSSTQMSVKNTSWKKSIAESNLVPYENERTTLFSTWTPLSDEKSNQRVN